MPPIVSIVGRKDSGKTALMVKLIAELCRRRYRVASIKHNLHGFEIDHEGTDSHAHFRAGAEVSAVMGHGKLAVVRRLREEPALCDAVERYMGDVDLVLTEGFETLPHPKIEIFHLGLTEAPLCRKGGDEWLAVACDTPLAAPVRRFSTHDIVGLADLIEARVLRGPDPRPIS